MAVATFTPVSIGLLASELIDDFDISRAQIGLLIAVTGVLAAAASPGAGRVTDLIGGRWAAVWVFAAGGAGFLLMAAAPVYAIMLVAAVVVAVSEAGGNPATNKLIAQHIPAGRRSTVTGIKQSGVQVGVFFGGLLVPLGAETLGWRTTLALVALIPIAALPVLFAVVPGDRPAQSAHGAPGPHRLPSAVWWLAAYGTLLGFGGAVTFLVPLFVEESLGLTPRVGGAAAAVIALAAIVGRMLWARAAERGRRYAGSLVWIAGLSVGALGALFASTWVGTWLMWTGAVALGLSASSWNAVGMLAVMDSSGSGQEGRASGVVMLGFLAGFGLGPPLFGWTVDQTSSYTTMWVIALVSIGLAGLVAMAWRRTDRIG